MNENSYCTIMFVLIYNSLKKITDTDSIALVAVGFVS